MLKKMTGSCPKQQDVTTVTGLGEQQTFWSVWNSINIQSLIGPNCNKTSHPLHTFGCLADQPLVMGSLDTLLDNPAGKGFAYISISAPRSRLLINTQYPFTARTVGLTSTTVLWALKEKSGAWFRRMAALF